MSRLLIVFMLAVTSASVYAQQEVLATNRKSETSVQSRSQDAVIITGVRFSYKLVQQWIDDFNKEYPDIQVIIESRGSADPGQFDILAEVYEHEPEVKQSRAYLYVARYAVVPVATSASLFAKTYSNKGISDQQLKQIFFHDIFADKEDEEKIKAPFTVYTRFQKAGAPKVFANFYGFEQKNIVGKAIAGSDEHLLKAILRDTTGVSYLPLPVVYVPETKEKVEGLELIPVDLDGNGRVKDEERTAFQSRESLLAKIEGEKKLNLPVEYFHLSVLKQNTSANAITFLKWVADNGSAYVNDFGFLKPESNRTETTQFLEFASKRNSH